MASTKKYSLKLIFNGLVFNKRTDDIKETLKEVAPQVLLTEVYVIANRTGKKELSERKLNLTQGKRIFRDEIAREVFVNNLTVTL